MKLWLCSGRCQDDGHRPVLSPGWFFSALLFASVFVTAGSNSSLFELHTWLLQDSISICAVTRRFGVSPGQSQGSTKRWDITQQELDMAAKGFHPSCRTCICSFVKGGPWGALPELNKMTFSILLMLIFLTKVPETDSMKVAWTANILQGDLCSQTRTQQFDWHSPKNTRTGVPFSLQMRAASHRQHVADVKDTSNGPFSWYGRHSQPFCKINMDSATLEELDYLCTFSRTSNDKGTSKKLNKENNQTGRIRKEQWSVATPVKPCCLSSVPVVTFIYTKAQIIHFYYGS